MKNFLKDTLTLIAGATVFSAGFCVFALPNKILTGGAGGVAIIINSFTGIPIGTGILLINIPLLITAFFVCGKKYTFKTVYAVILFSSVIDLFELLVPMRYTGNPLLASIYGGILSGLGMFILMSQSIVTGGSDLLAYIIQRLRPQKSISSLLLIIDGAVVTLGALVYNSLDIALYSMSLIIIMTLVLDNFLRGRSKSNLLFIFTKTPEKLRKLILEDIGRGLSLVDVTGGYSNEKGIMLMCATNLAESARLKKLVFESDESAFVIMTSADRVFGNGFSVNWKEEIT